MTELEKDLRQAQELSAHGVNVVTPGLHSYLVLTVWSRFSRVMVGKEQDRTTPSSRGKAEKNRQDRTEVVQNMTRKKGQWFREDSGSLQLCNPAPPSKKQSRCYHSVGRNPMQAGDCGNVPQHVLCKLWTL